MEDRDGGEITRGPMWCRYMLGCDAINGRREPHNRVDQVRWGLMPVKVGRVMLGGKG